MTRKPLEFDTRLAKALSHPLRQRLLMAYTDRVVSPSEVATELNEPLGDVSYHTKRLLAHGYLELVEAVRGRGGVKHCYRATIPYEVTDADWSTLSPSLRRRWAEPVVNRILDDVADAAAEGAAADDVHVSRTILDLDDQGWQELGALLEAVVSDALRLQRESAGRRGNEGRSDRSSALAILHVPSRSRREGR